MVSSPLLIIFQILYVVLSAAINTTLVVFQLFQELLVSLGYLIVAFGPLGIILAFLILVPIIYFTITFFSGQAKIFVIGISILILLFLLLLMILGI